MQPSPTYPIIPEQSLADQVIPASFIPFELRIDAVRGDPGFPTNGAVCPRVQERQSHDRSPGGRFPWASSVCRWCPHCSNCEQVAGWAMVKTRTHRGYMAETSSVAWPRRVRTRLARPPGQAHTAGVPRVDQAAPTGHVLGAHTPPPPMRGMTRTPLVRYTARLPVRIRRGRRLRWSDVSASPFSACGGGSPKQGRAGADKAFQFSGHRVRTSTCQGPTVDSLQVRAAFKSALPACSSTDSKTHSRAPAASAADRSTPCILRRTVPA
jgi:hypothetical protein